jgi:hypothetical protein
MQEQPPEHEHDDAAHELEPSTSSFLELALAERRHRDGDEDGVVELRPQWLGFG